MSDKQLRALVILVSLLVAADSSHAQTRPYTCSYSSPPLEKPAPVLLGWPDLEHEELAPGIRRELRVHKDVAITAPDYSLRIVDHGRRVTGEIVVAWPGVEFNHVTGGDASCQEWHIAEVGRLTQAILGSLATYVRCEPVKVLPRVQGCAVSFTADPGWHDLLRRSDALGMWTLDSAVTPQVGLDGVDVMVELRDAGGYRRYSYNSPEAVGGRGEREVAAMADLIDAALKVAHSQVGAK